MFLTNLRKSTKATLEIDYETLCKVNPRIIHASVSGFGQEGHLSDLGAFDPMGQARSGMMFCTGSDRPHLIHLAVLDQTASIALSQAVLTALFVWQAPWRRTGGAHLPLRHGAMDAIRQSYDLWMPVFDPVPTDRRMYSPLAKLFLLPGRQVDYRHSSS